MLGKADRLFGSIFERSTKSFSAYFCLVGSNLNVSCSTVSLTRMIFAGNDLTGNSFNYIF